ncbi:ParB N-terminal domain-containing protein [uncultured Pelagimonas sp.]|uniref:ParB N-terminal domain-containing protein n=1 Tax=uncultured Pelagimonas sp. TaxID=1618102 RepID=UPI002629D45F|nr:ParB N-terminal domain-containing protein [uncultured Pelagimonas sp.]
MARRKRLTPPRPDLLEVETTPVTAGPLSAPPIAQVAAEAASTAALQALSDEMTRAREAGRFIEALPLEAVDASYLVRDRLGVSGEEQEALVASLKARGQQTPIEVVALGEGRYGLIAGWRRLMALRQLFEETGDARFAKVEARVTRPGETAEAYRAMVEENEIRVGLSHYERARIAVKAVEEGVYPHDRAALDSLYSSASRAKKSKIRSFVSLVRHLDGTLRYPTAIGERLGLSLVKRLSEHRDFSAHVIQVLKRENPADSEAEQTALKQSLSAKTETKKRPESRPKTEEQRQDAIAVHWSDKSKEIRLSGVGVDAELAKELKAWIESRSCRS